jgi:hypothetical protein
VKILNEGAIVRCDHDGTVRKAPSQHWVFISEAEVLVEPDPEGRDIDWCPNAAPPMRSCGKALKLRVGYSDLVFIGDRPVVLDSLDQITDGTPPGNRATCRDAGQPFVASAV